MRANRVAVPVDLLDVASFEDGDEQCVAIGSDPDMLPGYRVDETAGGRVLVKTRMHYPACLKFLYPTEVKLPRKRTDFAVSVIAMSQAVRRILT